jgi:hypothetical protein
VGKLCLSEPLNLSSHNFLVTAALKSPTAIAGSTKYGEKGLYTMDSFADTNLPTGLISALVSMANNSLAKGTWSTYSTAYKHVMSCQEETGRSINFPMTKNDVLLFTSWLLTTRGIKATSAEVYLSALRQIHLVKGLEVPTLRPEIVKTVIQGAKHQDTIRDRLEGTPKRLPVTISMMKMIKLELGSMGISYKMMRLVWTVCTIAFFGAFRIHELLSRAEGYFDPCFTLLRENVKLKKVKIGKETEKILEITLKSPKEDRVGKEIVVDVYASHGLLCPVKAFEKWEKTNPPKEKNKPAFRDEHGTPLTGRKLNAILKRCLSEHIKYEDGFVSSHSFRAGIASLMGTLGYADNEIKAIGRWSSTAFESYLKLPRTKRATMARKIGSWKL